MRGECIFEDDELFVLNKPSGMLVHRGWGTAEVALVDLARERTYGRAAHPIQRLDRSASGPVLFAKNAQAAHAISTLAEAGHCRKHYLALVRGETPLCLDIDHPISRREDGPRVPARTLMHRVSTVVTLPRQVSLVVATPLTGRLHQIRRHLKHANHPLIGDVRYGKGNLNRAFGDGYGLRRLALHAYRWSVRWPETGRFIGGRVPLPEDLYAPLLAMGFRFDDERWPVELESIDEQACAVRESTLQVP
ncbi:MAG TPA: RluA family pseudouridine synthase [Polyangiaceae bacterium]